MKDRDEPARPIGLQDRLMTTLNVVKTTQPFVEHGGASLSVWRDLCYANGVEVGSSVEGGRLVVSHAD